MSDFDLSTVLGSNRIMTQHCARYIHEQVDAAGHPLFAGICYVSRHNQDWECWALFENRFSCVPSYHETTIDPDDPDLLAAARLTHVSIEVVRGHGEFRSL